MVALTALRLQDQMVKTGSESGKSTDDYRIRCTKCRNRQPQESLRAGNPMSGHLQVIITSARTPQMQRERVLSHPYQISLWGQTQNSWQWILDSASLTGGRTVGSWGHSQPCMSRIPPLASSDDAAKGGIISRVAKVGTGNIAKYQGA